MNPPAEINFFVLAAGTKKAWSSAFAIRAWTQQGGNYFGSDVSVAAGDFPFPWRTSEDVFECAALAVIPLCTTTTTTAAAAARQQATSRSSLSSRYFYICIRALSSSSLSGARGIYNNTHTYSPARDHVTLDKWYAIHGHAAELLRLSTDAAATDVLENSLTPAEPARAFPSCSHPCTHSTRRSNTCYVGCTPRRCMPKFYGLM
ncbi:unnamed protein product [Trichogramma brassicae]|uniref:Uncharacterized protein n=1 Tax=Trichogramma brassicae TaxID=86971 RepID=A0A6H5I1G6_9HYME|nr:unnamed protein product [Trichogramma brassicae]